MGKKRYARATVHDNYSQLSPETVGAISDIVVGIGHQISSDLLKKVRADTVVLQKNVHHPTDTNLLYDGCRRIIALSKKIADQFTIAGWRKNGHWKHQVKTSYRKISKVARSPAADRDQRLKVLSEFIPLVVLPKKGGRNQAEKMREGTKEFGKLRKWHSGIESAIHALVVGNGMKVCRDKGPIGYDRYVATAILGLNFQNLGNLLLEKERKKRKRDPLLAL